MSDIIMGCGHLTAGWCSRCRPSVAHNGHIGWSPDFQSEGPRITLGTPLEVSANVSRSLLKRARDYLEHHTSCRGECSCGLAELLAEIESEVGPT